MPRGGNKSGGTGPNALGSRVCEGRNLDKVRNKRRRIILDEAPAEDPNVDPYFSSVVVLSHFNGADASTTIVEETGNTNLTCFGNAQLDTAQFKFGTASALFDGTGDRIDSDAPEPTMDIGTQDFTMECWVRLAALPSAAPRTGYTIAAHYDSGANRRGWLWRILDTDIVQFAWGENGLTTPFNATSAALTWVTDQWYFMVVQRNGRYLSAWRDGVVVIDEYDAGSVTDFHYPDNIEALKLGYLNSTASARAEMNGWLDDFRWTMGVQRYTVSTTHEVPTAPFPDSA